MRIFLLLSFFSILRLHLFSQNLISNPSLEDENFCQKYHEACAPKAWRSNTLKAFLYYDYRISRQNETVVKPASGNRCISLRMYNTMRKEDRSYAQTPLVCQLEKGKQYRLQLQFMSPTFFVNGFEILFLDTIEITRKNDPIFEKSPQVKFEFEKPFSPNQWHTLETIYEASGNEIGLMIGNFKKDENTVVQLIRKKDKVGKRKRRVYHYFDNFSLTPIEPDSLDCDLVKNKQYIYEDSIRHFYRIAPHSVELIPEEMEEIIEDEIIEVVYEKPNSKPIIKEPFVIEKPFVLPNILFETNSDKLLSISYNSLDNLVVYLLKNKGYRLLIEGHTDNIGTEKKNFILSEKRAQSVANYLIINKINSSRISVNGKGESFPIASNETLQGRQLNRRVEFQIFRE